MQNRRGKRIRFNRKNCLKYIIFQKRKKEFKMLKEKLLEDLKESMKEKKSN